MMNDNERAFARLGGLRHSCTDDLARDTRVNRPINDDTNHIPCNRTLTHSETQLCNTQTN